MAYALYTRSLGAIYANYAVKITKSNSATPATVLSSPVGGLLNTNGDAQLDSAGNLAVYIDTSQTWVVTPTLPTTGGSAIIPPVVYIGLFANFPDPARFQVGSIAVATDQSNSEYVTDGTGWSLSSNSIRIRTIAQLSGTPSAIDAALRSSVFFQLDTDPVQLYRVNATGTAYTPIGVSGAGSGTVTSVQGAGSQGVTVTGGPVIGSGTLTIGLGAITPTFVAASGTITGSNLSGTHTGTHSGASSGTNTGDQTITLTGDVTGTGTTTVASTLATVNTNVGSFTNASITVDAKGRITAASTGTGGGGGSGSVTNTGGNLTSNSLVLGAGTVDTKVVAGFSTDGVSQLNLGVAGVNAGALNFRNTVSASVTTLRALPGSGNFVVSLPLITDTLVSQTSTDIFANKTLDTASNTFKVNGNTVIASPGTATITVPNVTTVLVGRSTTDTLTNKTFDTGSNTFLISGNQLTASNGTATVTLPNVTDTLVARTTTDTLTNKTLDTAGSNVIKVNGNTLAASNGTATVTLPNVTDTLVGRLTSDTLTNKTFDTASNLLKVNGNTVTAGSGTATITLPSSTDTLVGRATTDTLSNKTLTSPVATFPILQMTAAPSVDDTGCGTIITGLNAGATIAQWQGVYLDSTGKWQLTSASGSGTYPLRGLASAAYVNNNPATIVVDGVIRNDGWSWTTGGDIYMSTGLGTLTQTAPGSAGNVIQKIGFALSATTIRLSLGSYEYMVHA